MRSSLLLSGIALLLACWIGPLRELARQAFFGHMIVHMVVVAVAAPLLALAVAGEKYDPVRRFPKFFAPIPASVGELILIWAWHAPGPHHVARVQPWGFFAEQASFLLAGLWLWISAFGGSDKSLGQRGAGVVGLLLTSMHMTLLGALLALAPRVIYPHHQGFGSLSALQDQHLGGAVMILLGGIAYLSGGLYLTSGLLMPHESTETRSL